MNLDFTKQFEAVKKAAGAKWFNETYKPVVEAAVKTPEFKAVAEIMEPFGTPYPSYGPGAPDFDFTLTKTPTKVWKVTQWLKQNGFDQAGEPYGEDDYKNKAGVLVGVSRDDNKPADVGYISIWMPINED